MEHSKTKVGFRTKLIGRLHEPLPLRAALCLVLMASWYFAGYTPMSGRIAVATAKLERDGKRLALATEIEALRKEEVEFVDRLPPRSDPNEFVQYVLGGVRSSSLKLVSLSPEKPKVASPFEVASVRVELEGKYKDVEAFIRWVENDKRMLRIDGLMMSPDSKNRESLKIQLSLLGLMGVEESAKPAEPDPIKPKGAASKAGPSKKKAKG
jgi:hypothetical protein